MAKKVSVILPVYNCERYLDNAIKSVINQTVFDSLELILIDDGSRDTSPKICDSYSEKYSNITAFHQKNSGVSVARNTGIDLATGEYIAFLDSDDSYKSDFIEELLKHSENDLICCDYFNESEEEKHLSALFEGKAYSRSDFNYDFYEKTVCPEFYSCWNKLYKLSIIEEYSIRFRHGVKYAEDMLFVFEYLKHCDSFYYIDKPLYLYNINPNNTTSVVKNGFDVQRFIYNELKVYFDSIDCDKEIYRKIEDNFVFFTTLSINSEITYNGFFVALRYIKRILSSEFYELYLEKNYTEFKCTYDKVFFTLLKKRAAYLIVLWRKLFDLRSRFFHG